MGEHTGESDVRQRPLRSRCRLVDPSQLESYPRVAVTLAHTASLRPQASGLSNKLPLRVLLYYP